MRGGMPRPPPWGRGRRVVPIHTKKFSIETAQSKYVYSNAYLCVYSKYIQVYSNARYGIFHVYLLCIPRPSRIHSRIYIKYGTKYGNLWYIQEYSLKYSLKYTLFLRIQFGALPGLQNIDRIQTEYTRIYIKPGEKSGYSFRIYQNILKYIYS